MNDKQDLEKFVEFYDKLIRNNIQPHVTFTGESYILWYVSTDGTRVYIEQPDIVTTYLTAAGLDTTKICSACGKRQPLACFTGHHLAPDGIGYECRHCRGERYKSPSDSP